jgi:hypothetical protein
LSMLKTLDAKPGFIVGIQIADSGRGGVRMCAETRKISQFQPPYSKQSI